MNCQNCKAGMTTTLPRGHVPDGDVVFKCASCGRSATEAMVAVKTDRRTDERHGDAWTDEQRREHEADAEQARRARNAEITIEEYREKQRQNELAHGELTRRFLASKGATE